MMRWAKRWFSIGSGSRQARKPRPVKRIRLQVEALEDRVVPTLQVLSPADPTLFATGAGGGLSGSGRTISDDGRFVVYGSGDNVVPGDHNYSGDVFVRDLQTGAVTLVSVNLQGTT